MAKTLYEKLFDAHVVYEAQDETPLLYIDRHLVHEVTSPQAFDGLRAHNRPVRQPGKTFATMDHNVSTQTKDINASGEMARIQMQELIKNCNEFGVELYDLNHPFQGIVHVMGPEQGVTLPGMTIVCGDSHTATHGKVRRAGVWYRDLRSRTRAGHANPEARARQNHEDRS